MRSYDRSAFACDLVACCVLQYYSILGGMLLLEPIYIPNEVYCLLHIMV